MTSSVRLLRRAGLCLAALCGAYLVMPGGTAEVPATQIGTAQVAIGGDTARVVENVSYRQDVTRIGDVVVVDGQPTAAITDDRVASMWAIVDAVWPAEHRSKLRQLSVIEEDARGLVGVVHPSAVGGWILSLDAADLGDPALLEETIVHELAHVVTLDSSVFTFGDDGTCPGEQISLGCAHDGSVLAEFTARFWADRERGADHEYVNDYAGTAPHEDLAETFTAMVWGWTPAGETIADKVDVIAADPGLARLATDLRALLDRRAALRS
ncbi:MAG: hypothetical protein AAGA37_12280 [Actinomycetota bacterium]